MRLVIAAGSVLIRRSVMGRQPAVVAVVVVPPVGLVTADAAAPHAVHSQREHNYECRHVAKHDPSTPERYSR